MGDDLWAFMTSDYLWTIILGVAIGSFLGKLLWVFFQVACKRHLERVSK